MPISYSEFVEKIHRRISLNEMALPRKNLVTKVQNLQMQIAIHIAKIHLYPDNIARHHWEAEVNAWLRDIQFLVYDRNKRLTAEQYFKILWVEPFEDADLVLRCQKRFVSEKYARGSDSIEEIEKKIESLYKKISEQISRDEFHGLTFIQS